MPGVFDTPIRSDPIQSVRNFYPECSNRECSSLECCILLHGVFSDSFSCIECFILLSGVFNLLLWNVAFSCMECFFSSLDCSTVCIVRYSYTECSSRKCSHLLSGVLYSPAWIFQYYILLHWMYYSPFWSVPYSYSEWSCPEWCPSPLWTVPPPSLECSIRYMERFFSSRWYATVWSDRCSYQECSSPECSLPLSWMLNTLIRSATIRNVPSSSPECFILLSEVFSFLEWPILLSRVILPGVFSSPLWGDPSSSPECFIRLSGVF